METYILIAYQRDKYADRGGGESKAFSVWSKVKSSIYVSRMLLVNEKTVEKTMMHRSRRGMLMMIICCCCLSCRSHSDGFSSWRCREHSIIAIATGNRAFLTCYKLFTWSMAIYTYINSLTEHSAGILCKRNGVAAHRHAMPALAYFCLQN